MLLRSIVQEQGSACDDQEEGKGYPGSFDKVLFEGGQHHEEEGEIGGGGQGCHDSKDK